MNLSTTQPTTITEAATVAASKDQALQNRVRDLAASLDRPQVDQPRRRRQVSVADGVEPLVR
jgi:hypothetical protein